MEFTVADESQANKLTQLAVESNDIYGTRVCSYETASQVLEVSDDLIRSGLVEILQDGDTILGFYSLKDVLNLQSTSIIELGHLFVSSNHVKRGIGTILFQRAVSKAKFYGAKTMKWISDPDSVGFYIKMGSVLIDRAENILNPSVDVSIMECDLSA